MDAGLLGRIETELEAFVTEFRPELYSGADAARLVDVFAHVERVAAAGKVLAARQAARANGWQRGGYRSAEEWLARTTGTSISDATAALATGRHLEQLPETDRALRAGKLSEPQASAVASASAADPSAEHGLLNGARTGNLDQLRRTAREVRQAAAGRGAAVDREAIRRSRYFRHWTAEDGAFEGRFRLTPDHGAIVLGGLSAYREQVFAQARRDDQHDTTHAYEADALVEMARHATDVDVDTPPGPDPAGAEAGGAGETNEVADSPQAERDGEMHDPIDTEQAERNDESNEPADTQPVRPKRETNEAAKTGWAGRTQTPRPPADDSHGAPTDGQAQMGDTDTATSTLDTGRSGREGETSAGPPGRTPHGPTSAGPTPPGPTSAGPTPPGPTPAGPTSSGPTPPPPLRDPRSRSRRPAVIHIRVDRSALIRGWTEAGEVCEITGVGPVPIETVRAAASDAVLKAILVDGDQVIDVRNAGRTVPTHLRAALEERDRTCVVPGCDASHRLEIHHLLAFSLGGATSLTNLARVCAHHHDQITYQGAVLSGTHPSWHWYAPGRHRSPDATQPRAGGPGRDTQEPPDGTPRSADLQPAASLF